MIIYQSVIFITILIATINSHGYHHQYHHQEKNRQGNERTWFQMSIPFLDASIQFQPPGFDPDRLFDMVTAPFQQWNPLEPPPFMRPFFDRPSQFRPMMPPPPPGLPPFNPSLPPPPSPSSEPSPSTPSVLPPAPSTSSNPNSISDSEPESTFSISSSTYNPSRKRYKPRWVPHHPRRPFSGKRPGSGGRRGVGNGYGSGGNSFGGSSSNGGGCRNVPGTKGGRKCRPGQRFWEKSKPSSPLPPSWPFFVFPPPRPSYDDDDSKPEVPNTFTEVTKTIDPACGNRHLPRPTKPSTNDSNPIVTTLSPASENNERDFGNNVTTQSTSSSPSSTTTTESPTTSESAVDIQPSPQLSPSSSVQPSEKPSTPPEVLKSSNVEPEKNPSESDSRNGSNGSEGESGKKEEEKKEEKEEDKPESSSVSYLSKEEEENKMRERTNINNGQAISSSGSVTTMGPLERSSSSGEDVKVKQEENEEKKKKIDSKENDEVGKMKDVDLKYSSSVTSPVPELSSSPSENVPTTVSPNDVNNESLGDFTTMSPADLSSNGYSMNEADTVPDVNDKGLSSNSDDDDDKKFASPEVEVKRKRQTEKEQFIKQIESMSIEDFRRLATKIASISI